MKHLRTFNESDLRVGLDTKQSDYSIEDFYLDCKLVMTFHKNDTRFVDLWTDHFIGDGYLKKIKDRVDKLFEELEHIDIHDIKSRLFDISMDLEVPYDCYPAIFTFESGSTGTKPVKFEQLHKNRIMCDILYDIINPTISIGSSFRKSEPMHYLRDNNSKKYVLDKKYQCVNFFKNQDITDIIDQNGTYSDKLKYKEYNIDNILYDIFKCGVSIYFGNHSYNIKFNMGEMERRITDVIPALVQDIDYEDIKFENNSINELSERRFSTDIEINDYNVKIILNL